MCIALRDPRDFHCDPLGRQNKVDAPAGDGAFGHRRLLHRFKFLGDRDTPNFADGAQLDQGDPLRTEAVIDAGGGTANLINYGGLSGVANPVPAYTTPITVKGAYTELAATELDLSVADTQTAAMQVTGAVTIAGGTLHVVLPKSWNADGQTATVIHAKNLQGQFAAIVVDGFKATPVRT